MASGTLYTLYICIYIGLASLTFRKKEAFHRGVAEALNISDAWASVPETGQPSNTLSEGIETALLYIKNAANNIMNPKYTRINTNSNGYISKLSQSSSGKKLLYLAGFKESVTTASNSTSSVTPSDADSAVYLTLVHKNAAILNYVAQVT